MVLSFANYFQVHDELVSTLKKKTFSILLKVTRVPFAQKVKVVTDKKPDWYTR